MKIIETLATLLTCLGMYALSEHNDIGFSISILASVLWMVLAIDSKMMGLLVVNIVLIFINLNGTGII